MSVWIAETLIATTLLMALVMMVRRPVARWLGAGAAYLLWALPLTRMLMPALPSDVDPSPLHRIVDQAGLPDLLTMQPASSPASPDMLVPWAFPWLETGVALWGMGLVLFLAVQVVGYARFRRHMLAGATLIDREGRIHIVTSAQASGPLAFGVLHPYIVLPVDFALRYDAQEQDMAIAHERAHHQRGDLIANMIALLLLAIHWCNPVAWFAYRAYRADQETACDARVLSLYGRDHAHAYGRAILKAAGGRQWSGACHLTRLATLKGRLKMLSTHETSLRRISWGMAVVALVTAAGLALTASGSRAAQQMAAITEKVENVDLARLTDLVVPRVQAGKPATMVAAPAVPLVSAPSVDLARPDPQAIVAPSPPAVPIAPAADMVAPVPPLPPVPPVTVRNEKGRIVVAHADGRIETHRVPTDADIARQVPVVDIRDGCEGGKDKTTRSETVDANGRRHIRVRICHAAMDRAVAQAERQADRAARQADVEAAWADRAARTAHVAALRELRAARARIATSTSMPADARAEALRDIDRSIADMRSEQP